MSPITPVILCGGGGTRLWPQSRHVRPKPFIPLIGGDTLFVQTLARCHDDARFADPVIVAGADHIGHVSAQLPHGVEAEIIVEPCARNTAPAIALAAATLPDDALMLVCPSDHYIADTAAFHAAVDCAATLAADGHLVAFGIHPESPHTGYGYIRRGAAMGCGAVIDRFVEKPDLATAQGFLDSGDFVWNGGIFCFAAGALMRELAAHRPAIADAVRASVAGARRDGAFLHPDAAAFAAIKGESIDYAVMENTGHAAMVDVSMGWSDIGSWSAVAERLPVDGAGNHAPDPANLIDCRNVMVRSDGPRVSVVGCDDLVIVVNGDEVLVCRRDAAQAVGQLPGAKSQ